ncbi:MAG TPA: hypothetical protein VJM11_10130 [Nevskiaceae bacterium]|nr:hypothetical protein [Nevskiaceae bacterium]
MLLALALCAATATVDARYVYRWSENGVDHYSDVEHPGAERVWVDDAKAQNRSGSGAPRAAGAPAGDPLQDPTSPEFRQMRCDQKQGQLKQYESAAKLVEKNALGVEREYTPEEKDKLVAQTRAEVAKYCGESEEP